MINKSRARNERGDNKGGVVELFVVVFVSDNAFTENENKLMRIPSSMIMLGCEKARTIGNDGVAIPRELSRAFVDASINFGSTDR